MINNNIELNEEDISSSHFNLNLGVKGLRIRHWNVNNLTTGKFEQIKLYLSGNLSYSILIVQRRYTVNCMFRDYKFGNCFNCTS